MNLSQSKTSMTSLFTDLAFIIENLNGYCFITDTNGKIYYINSYLKKAVIDKNNINHISDFIPSEHTDTIIKSIQSSFSTNKPITFSQSIDNYKYLSHIIPIKINGYKADKFVIIGYPKNIIDDSIIDNINVIIKNFIFTKNDIHLFLDEIPFGIAFLDNFAVLNGKNTTFCRFAVLNGKNTTFCRFAVLNGKNTTFCRFAVK